MPVIRRSTAFAGVMTVFLLLFEGVVFHTAYMTYVESTFRDSSLWGLLRLLGLAGVVAVQTFYF